MERVAILPFKNQGEASWNYLTEGLTELTIDTLMNQPQYLVIAKESVKQLLQQEDGYIEDIYDRLHIDLLITAALKVSHNLELTISAWRKDQVEPIWTKHLNAALKQIIFFGNELVKFLNFQFKQQTDKEPATYPKVPKNRQAYRAYLLGNHYLHKWDRGYTELALTQFEKVITEEPDFVPAYLGSAKAIIFLVGRGFRLAKENYPQVLDTLDQMSLLYPNYGELYIYKGIIEFFFNLNWDSAYENIVKGLKNFSEASEAYTQLSFLWYGLRQYDQALEAIHVAMEYNPLSISLLNMKGDVLISAERYEAATKTFQAILELQPNDKVALENLMYIASLQKDERLTKKYLRLVTKDAPVSPILFPRLGYVYAYLGMDKEVQEILHQLAALDQQKSNLAYGRLANIYAGSEDWEKAMNYAERLFKARTGILYVLTDPQFKPLRNWKRYQQLEQQIQLPQQIQSETTINIQTDLKKVFKVNPNNLLYAKSEGKYTTVLVYNNFRIEKTLLRLTIKNLVKQLPADQFFHSHRSYVVNTNLKFKQEGNARGYTMTSIEYGFVIPISRGRIEEMKQLFQNSKT